MKTSDQIFQTRPHALEWGRVRIHWETNEQEGIYIDPPKKPSIFFDEGGPNFFIWEEGNYSCDCNRSIFFLGRSYDDAMPCGKDYFKIPSIECVERGLKLRGE